MQRFIKAGFCCLINILIVFGPIEVQGWDFPSPMALSPLSWPDAGIGEPYQQSLEISGGSAPYQWHYTGLPAECDIQADESAVAVLVCAPLTVDLAGVYSVKIRVKDSDGTELIEEQEFIVSDVSASPVIEDQELLSGNQGQDYEHFFSATQGRAPRFWQKSAGRLPDGMKLYEDGLLYGRPNESGNFSFTVTVTDSKGDQDSRAFSLSVRALAVLPLEIETPDDPIEMEQFTNFSKILSAGGGDGNYVWRFVEGSETYGLSLLSNGALIGAPDEEGEHVLLVRVIDGSGQEATTALPINVSAESLKYATPGVDTFTFVEGWEISWGFPLTGGKAPYSISLAGGRLPLGTELDQDIVGISGAPREQGKFDVAIEVVDQDGNRLERSITLTVIEPHIDVISMDPDTVAVNLFSSIAEGGMIQGGGSYAQGESVTVKATPQPGYYFLQWTQNGHVVSGNATHTFTAQESLDLTAHFAPMNRLLLHGEAQNIDIPFNAGIVGTGAKEIIAAAPDTSITFSAGNQDRVSLPHNLEDYTITSEGIRIFFVDNSGNQITLSVNGASIVSFTNGEASLDMVFLPGQMPYVNLGGAKVGSEPLNHALVELSPTAPIDPIANSAALNRLLLNGFDQELNISFNAGIVGTGAKETLNVAPDTNIVFSAGNGDRINLPHNLEDYTITSEGIRIFLADSSGSRITLSVNGTSIVGFANGDASLGMVFLPGQMPYVELGGAAVGSDSLDHGLVAMINQLSDVAAIEHPFVAGSGTFEDPYLVVTAEQLDRVREHLSSYFMLIGDLDLGDVEAYMPIGTSGNPFTGGFDGNGYTIRNLTIDAGELDYVGLFGSISDAVIHHTGIENVDVKGGNLVGGLVGHAVNATISDSFVTGFVGGQSNVGGLAGYIEASPHPSIVNAYANCDVEGEFAVGGLVGNLGITASIVNAYAVGSVSGQFDTGGLVGRNSDGAGLNVMGGFWDMTVGPQVSSGGSGKTTDEMMQRETFAGWDFKGIWEFADEVSYPNLKR